MEQRGLEVGGKKDILAGRLLEWLAEQAEDCASNASDDGDDEEPSRGNRDPAKLARAAGIIPFGS